MGKGKALDFRAPALGRVHMDMRARSLQVSGLRVTLYHFYSHSTKNENLIEYTVSSQHRTSGVSCSLAQGHRPMYNRPPNGP
jgi:hypothetical protein